MLNTWWHQFVSGAPSANTHLEDPGVQKARTRDALRFSCIGGRGLCPALGTRRQSISSSLVPFTPGNLSSCYLSDRPGPCQCPGSFKTCSLYLEHCCLDTSLVPSISFFRPLCKYHPLSEPLTQPPHFKLQSLTPALLSLLLFYFSSWLLSPPDTPCIFPLPSFPAGCKPCAERAFYLSGSLSVGARTESGRWYIAMIFPEGINSL